MKPNDELLLPAEAGEYLGGVPPTTLQWWRSVGRGPVFLKIGRKVAYRRSALDHFLQRGERKPEAANAA